MTFPKEYNAPSLKQEAIIIKRVILEYYELGKIEILSPWGNSIYIYDLERTLCDILWGSVSDIQIVIEAMKRYAASKEKDIYKLMNYAEQLRVKDKVLRYMEILLWLLKIQCNKSNYKEKNNRKECFFTACYAKICLKDF